MSLPTSVVALSEAENFLGLYELFRKKRVISCVSSKSGGLSLLMSNGKLIKLSMMNTTRVLTTENPWSSLLPSEIECGLICEDFPCLLYLSNGSLLSLTSNAGNLFTSLPKYITSSTLSIGPKLRAIHSSISNKLFLGVSEDEIQIMGYTTDSTLVVYDPFSINTQSFVCENAVFFSKKAANVFYVLDRPSEVPGDVVQFGSDSSQEYLIKKYLIHQKDINESKFMAVSFPGTLLSVDINQLDHFAFVTADCKAHILRGTKGISKAIDATANMIRWHSLGQVLIILDSNMRVLALDWNLNSLSTFQLNTVPFLRKIDRLISTNGLFVVVGDKNAAILSFPCLKAGKGVIDLHLRADKLNLAIEALEMIQGEREFTEGFFLCWKYVIGQPSTQAIQWLEELWTKYCHSKLEEPFAKKLMIKLGYKLIQLRAFESAFLLARKVRNIRLISDLAYYADHQGFKGIAFMAKRERKDIDENYTHPKEELEQLVALTGKHMTVADYSVLLTDLEEVISVSSLAEAQSKGGYIEEKNFWEINLEQYAKGLELEGQGAYEQALELYTSNSLSQEINRVKLIMEHSAKPLSAYETTLSMEEY